MAVTKEEIIEALKEMTALELSELVHELEDVFGVSAAAPVAVAAPVAEAEPVEEKTIFDVVLEGYGDQKLSVIKVVRSITSLGLKDAKVLVESAPKTILEGVKKEEAEEIKAKIEEAGGVVTLA